MITPRSLGSWLLALAVALLPATTLCAQQAASVPPNDAPTVFKTTVRRVIVDVVVTDRNGKTVPGLTRQDFSVFEDNASQQVLSFDALGFGPHMDYTPPQLPTEPPNTFVNLPALPEKGPLYVLLYDLVNMQTNEEQILARKELIKFIADKPEGSRFAIFMFSDGLHLVQGFTSDRSLLFAAIDPNHSRAHVPKIFLMGRNYGRDDAPTSVYILKAIAKFLDGLPGRKNVIWFSGGFPLALFPDEKDNLEYYEDVKQTLDLLARNQIAIYPVDTRGVSIENPHAPPGTVGDANPDARSGSPGASGAAASAAQGLGVSQLSASYIAEDEIARATGGRAFYSRNDIGVALEQATEDGASYYSLSYAPSNPEDDTKLHTIRVELARKGYTLAYRRSYYGLDPAASQKNPGASSVVATQGQALQRTAGDTLDANMRHGAPMAHALIFGAHVQPIGSPALGTSEQMAQLSDQPAFFRTRRRKASLKALAPIQLQKYSVHYTIMAHQLQGSGNTAPHLEVAAAAFDADGTMLNAAVNDALAGDPSQTAAHQAYRVEQELLVPLNAATIRVAIRDAYTDRIGAMEITLPLQTEPPSEAHTIAKQP